jgi:hypothetical protein
MHAMHPVIGWLSRHIEHNMTDRIFVLLNSDVLCCRRVRPPACVLWDLSMEDAAMGRKVTANRWADLGSGDAEATAAFEQQADKEPTWKLLQLSSSFARCDVGFANKLPMALCRGFNQLLESSLFVQSTENPILELTDCELLLSIIADDEFHVSVTSVCM